ncbi:MAG: family 10 glycosylhydrolase [Verrucomicrobia bacterium]|nr:family 10 glycosylhydrolase [Verrucomicrobiota bacterium]
MMPNLLRRLALAALAGGLPACLPLAHAASPPEFVIDSGDYANDHAARTAWKPMGETPQVKRAPLNHAPALCLPCPFAETPMERASWDRAVTLDLSDCRGVEFQVLCRDASPVSYFSLYFQSGPGWYHASFYPESDTDWNTITVNKTDAGTEGQPAGWGQIRTIRLSAWRGRAVNTEFYLRNLRKTGVLGGDASVAILRADSLARRSPDEARTVGKYVGGITEPLHALGVGCSVIGDQDVTAPRLDRARVVVLPYNPGLDQGVAGELARYVERGGKLLLFYTVPAPLMPLLGIAGGHHLQATPNAQFAAIHCAPGSLPGAPARVSQHSWNINAFQPLPNSGRVLAEWLDERGQPTGHAAVLGSAHGLVMTHVLLDDDAPHQRRLLLAMLGHLAPEVWRQAAHASLNRVGALSRFNTFAELADFITRHATNRPAARLTLDQAARRLQSARDALERQDHPQAVDHADAARALAETAFCQAQSPQPGEFRAFWCHSAFGVRGRTWDDAVRRLAENGFTAILPNMLWGGAAFYPSKVLPVAPEAAARGDQIAACLAAAHRYGLQVHVWKVNWYLGSATPREFRDRLRREHRLQASSRGREEAWLCPSHPDNQRLEIDSMLEIVRRYNVDGLHFDYIRYPGGDHCFCDGCKERFQHDASVHINAWPADVLRDGPLQKSWLEWRRSQITAVVQAVSTQTRTLKPHLKISAAVFRNWPRDRDTVGQDWKLWCDRGYLDFVCPMDYTSSNRSFENMLVSQLEWAGRVPCYPGIGLSASSSHFGIDRLIEQIQITRRHRTGGFVIFNYGVTESRDVLPRLGLGITAVAQTQPEMKNQQP